LRPQYHRQLDLAFSGRSPLQEAVEELARAGADGRGAIFTRRSVVDFILDLVGYTVDEPLHRLRLLEPSLGDGDFLFPALDRLFATWRRSGIVTNPVIALRDAIRGVELHQETFAGTKTKLLAYLRVQGLSVSEANTLADSWIQQGDFLLTEFSGSFTHIVGNPPYIRQELIPDVLISEYRTRFHTIFDRADIYIPFIEHSLALLESGARLGFICSDRWMKNRYGGPLRQLVSSRFHLETYVDMVDTDAFHSDVIAYPAIVVIANQSGSTTRLAHRPDLNPEQLTKLSKALCRGNEGHPGVFEFSHVAASGEPWALSDFDRLAVIRKLEARYPTLEEAGCKVGIGVATGADSVFIGKFDELDVEDERKLPLVATRDIKSGNVAWNGLGVLNPFNEKGGLVKLEDYPRFARYLQRHEDKVRRRHVSRRNPEGWYRTIDRIYPELARQPKLLIPDIKGEAHIVYEKGELYPHHNLYYVTSLNWNLLALQAVLRSRVAQAFVETYSTRMRGGYLRFQAQYLRRIRLPHWKEVSGSMRKKLISAGRSGNLQACNDAAYELYGLRDQDREAMEVRLTC